MDGGAQADATREATRTAWLFDVDGVLTDPERKMVAAEALFGELLRRLDQGEPIGLNTGRSFDFIIENVLAPLEARVSTPERLAGMIAVGEKGGVWIVYSPDGRREEHVADGVSLPADLQEAVRALVAQPPFADCMFFDETKRTMISVELRAGRTLEAFALVQRELVLALERLLADMPYGQDLRIDPSRIATDVEYASMGKGRGAATFVKLLEARDVHPQRYVCFGDSASDYAMLAELLRQGKRAELVFVGERDLLAGKDTRFVTFTDQLFDRGTLSYLRAY